MKNPKVHYLKNYQPYHFIVDHIDLVFKIHDDHTSVIATTQIRKHPDFQKDSLPLVFNKKDYPLTSVIANGMILLPEEYICTDEIFKLANTPEQFELEITSILKPHKNTSLEGLFNSGNIICTQCEAEGFRKITPFPDRPDVMTTFTCTIIADKVKYPVLLSNGNLIKSGNLDNNKHFARWEDPFKKPSYLFALIAGDLEHIHDTFKTKTGRSVDLKIYSEKDNIDQCYHAMESLRQSMKWDENRFGLEYDLDLYQIVAINDFNAGAMENKGLNIFNSKYVLAKPETATDEDFMNIQGVIGHEYFHNWTGNRVTLKNWFQLSLKEGLTVFRDQEFSSDLNSRGVKRISSVRNLRAFQFPEDSGPMTHPVRPESYIEMNNFYTMTVYEKGSEIVRMVHQLLGEDRFQKGMKLYFELFDGMAVTVEDFIAVMEKAGKIDLKQFQLWYKQSGTPMVDVKRCYNANNQQLDIIFTQKIKPDRNQDRKQPLHIPIKLGILDSHGKDLVQPKHSVVELTSECQTFSFKSIPPNSTPSLFREFSAPVTVQTDLTKDELAFLMAKDSDEFNKWDAAQTLFIDEIKRFVGQIQTNDSPVIDPGLLSAFNSALNDKNLNKSFLAKMLTLPSETEIKDHFDLIDVESINTARFSLTQQIARNLESLFYEKTADCSIDDPESISQESIALRSFKNLCLSYIGSLKSDESTAFVKSHYLKAKNMTDELASFKILCDINIDTKKEAVNTFYQKWHNDVLVLDKWFAIQAGSILPDTTQKVTELLKHPLFSLKNPNKVRSLIFIFTFFNPIHFHEKSGKNYTFISDKILELDKINPQIAARLATCFNHRKKYDQTRDEMMIKELERIIETKDLSKNVYEIASRALE